MLRHVQFTVDQDAVARPIGVGEERADLAVVDASQRSRVLPLDTGGFPALLRETRRVRDQYPAWISETLHRVVTDEITQPIGVPRREVQEPLERLRLMQAGILGDRPPVLALQRSKQAPQIPHSMGAGIRPIEQSPGPRTDIFKLRIPCGKIFSRYRVVREISLFREKLGHASNNGTSSGRIHLQHCTSVSI